MKRISIILGILLTVLLFSCAGGGNGDDGYLILAYHNLDSFGSETQVEIYQGGLNGVSGADVTINGIEVPEQFFFVPFYRGTDLISAGSSDEVILNIKIGGEEILNTSLTIPSAIPSITTSPDPWSVSNSQTIEWANGSDADFQEVYISWADTQSGDDYNPSLASGIISHNVPANTVAYDPDFSFFNLEVRAVNETTLSSFKSGSSFKVYTSDWVMPDTEP